MIAKYMQKKGKILIFTICFILIISTVFTFVPNDIYGATKNVEQSRKVTEIDDFPESYRSGLRRIKEEYPNAQFIYFDTGLDWYDDLLQPENLLKYGRNLVPSYSPDSWKASIDNVEPGWVSASQPLIEYYMDPRNFLTPYRAFQFISLSYDESQTLEGTKMICDNSFMGGRTLIDPSGKEISYAEALYQIGKESGVSPYLLATRIRQEQGGGGSSMISGSYSAVPGYYNFFNIGATGGSTADILTNGLRYAKSQGWDTPYKSLLGGAQELADTYVGAGRDCLYLHHFNVSAINGNVSYLPYMTSIEAPYHEAQSLSDSYTNKEAPYTFVIPVYKNMPNEISPMPEKESKNHLLKSLQLDDGEISIGEFKPMSVEYKAVTTKEDHYVKLKAEKNNSTSILKVNGVETSPDVAEFNKSIIIDNGFNDITLTVISETGLSKDYHIQLIKDDGKAHYESDTIKLDTNTTELTKKTTVNELKAAVKTLNCRLFVIGQNNQQKAGAQECVTGDTMIITDNNSDVIYSAMIVLPGDINKDNAVDENDIKKIKGFLLESASLTYQEQLLSDLNHDGKISVTDYGLLKNKIQKQTPASEIAKLNVVANDKYKADDLISVTLNNTNKNVCVSGYLNYNEGQLRRSDNNSGHVRFIADNTGIFFEDGRDHIELKSEIPSGTIEFTIEIMEAFDCASGKVITPEVSKKTIEITNDEKAVKTSEACVNGHSYKYTSENNGDKNKNSVAIGICKNCGKQNVRMIDGTRKMPIGEIKIQIVNSDTYQTLPNVSLEDKSAELQEIVWENESGVKLEAKSSEIVAKSGQVYKLATLKLAPSADRYFDQDVTIDVNGQQFYGNIEVKDDQMIIQNLGQINIK